jgi:hypothetical protein
MFRLQSARKGKNVEGHACKALQTCPEVAYFSSVGQIWSHGHLLLQGVVEMWCLPGEHTSYNSISVGEQGVYFSEQHHVVPHGTILSGFFFFRFPHFLF